MHLFFYVRWTIIKAIWRMACEGKLTARFRSTVVRDIHAFCFSHPCDKYIFRI